MAKIEPKTLKGFRDFLPREQIARARFISTIQASFEAFGFDPLETPALEYTETLTGKYGDEGDKLMYRFKDNGDRDVALRYDLTIPLARVVAQNLELKKPWRRYQIAPVWRAENTQKGRFREFYQCDADIVGSTSPLADAEILALAGATLTKLLSAQAGGVKDFEIRVNDRRLLDAFFDAQKIDTAKRTGVLRAMDKLAKVGEAGVGEELEKIGVEKATIKNILRAVVSNVVPKGSELEKIIRLAREMNPLLKISFDFSIARGLDYYTGLIFETVLTKAPTYGSVLSGGRYDNLVGMFANREVPAVGMSIGLDRLLSALTELKLIDTVATTTKVLIVNMDESLESDYLRMAGELRSAGVNTALYYESGDMGKQLKYASDRGIRYALIYGADEAKEGKVVIKDLSTGKQEKVDSKSIVKFFRS
jgi:histidyl-tRNA synthetase